ncbi:gamma-glutamylcyclotransferase [Candidatus Nitrotoga fabula]|uniref:Gamma-glutamylcyclotransferase family protein n=1 Tax=Candidatus Nitrotoga fabula TaxID=2182327 RepID=A0A916BCS1_9PROT|nr:gamma-glutamylcyclotransferase [Candidatus Nitrotoga fabula]CAE6723165.1 Gamma-glutamylcyclotransferase family protein [Candidatus Nitrotoga fabula]
MKIFVYGTLLRGMLRAPVLNDSEFLGSGFIQGSFYDLGEYPGVCEGKDPIYGEIYQVDQNTLKTLDQIEGYNPAAERQSLYVRKNVFVTPFDGGTPIEAITYFYNGDITGCNLIACGDYRRYIMENTSDDQWYLAYGSNMNHKQMIDRVGAAKQVIAGYVNGYQLVFNKCAEDGGVAENIGYIKGNRCPVLAYQLTKEQLNELDFYEGAGTHYIRLGLQFNFMDKEKRRFKLGHVYIAHPSMVTEYKVPSKNYLNAIRDGYIQNGFKTGELMFYAMHPSELF